MKQTSPFVISEFTNPSGEVVFRVSGWLDGKRIRKNFPSRPEARAELQLLEIEAVQGETGFRRTVTRLTEEQLREDEAVFRRLENTAHSVTFCAEYPLDRLPIVPPNLQRLRAAVAKTFDLSKDVMRHTFISMFVAKFRSMGEAALQAGNSETIIRNHYLNLQSIAEAELFWSIVPLHGENECLARTQAGGDGAADSVSAPKFQSIGAITHQETAA